MKGKAMRFSGPLIVYTAIIATLVSVYTALDSQQIVDSSRYFLRVSGRIGLLLLFISFGASALHTIFNAGWTRYLIHNRRYFGISTAFVLWVHFLVIINLSGAAPDWFAASVPWFVFYPGAVIFILVGLMALTSNRYSQEKLGMKVWKRFHAIAGYAAATTFLYEYLLVVYLQPFLMPDYRFEIANSPLIIYSFMAIAALLLLLRLYNWSQRSHMY
jgi:sulfoxide reductase heme-binding subunit YedZ